MTNFIDFTAKQIEDGSWVEGTAYEWGRDKFLVPRVIDPVPSGDSDLKQAVEAMIESNGSYARGDHANINTRPVALDMAFEAQLALDKRGIKSNILLNPSSEGQKVNRLMKTIFGDVDLGSVDTQNLDGFMDAYSSVLERARHEGNSHWIVTTGNAPKIEQPEDRIAVSVYRDLWGKALPDINTTLLDDGRMKSLDLWFYPSQLDIDLMNERLPEQEHWKLPEWREVVFKSDMLPVSLLESIVNESEDVELLKSCAKKLAKK